MCDQIETIVAQTGETGFHFVDEAAPPALLRDLSLEILKRNLQITWWTNIRFEKSFSPGLTHLMKMAGCIAVSGGLEVASDRLLKLIKKGVSIEKVTKVTHSFTQAGIMVHAYLMYGFPTQTKQETVDSLEIVRQLFENGVIQSAYWHQFSMTAHSPIGLHPENFEVEKVNPELGTFANNDLIHEDLKGADHTKFSAGLKKSLFNYMHGIGFDFPLNDWFEFKVPRTSHRPNEISNYIKEQEFAETSGKNKIVWTGFPEVLLTEMSTKKSSVTIFTKSSTLKHTVTKEQAIWIKKLLQTAHYQNTERVTYGSIESDFNERALGYFLLVWNEPLMQSLRENGLLII